MASPASGGNETTRDIALCQKALEQGKGASGRIVRILNLSLQSEVASKLGLFYQVIGLMHVNFL